MEFLITQVLPASRIISYVFSGQNATNKRKCCLSLSYRQLGRIQIYWTKVDKVWYSGSTLIMAHLGPINRLLHNKLKLNITRFRKNIRNSRMT
jgi:hypothetical protein